MASLPTRTTASFASIAPVPNLTVLDNEFNQYVGASGIFNGGTTGTKLLVKTSDGSDPPLELDQVGAGPLAEWKQNGTLKTSIANSGQIVSAVATGTAPFSIASTTVSTNLNADLLDGRELVGIKVSFSIGFLIADPSTATVGFGESGALIVPAGGTFTITKVKVIYNTGSHTAGGSVSFQIFRIAVGSLGTVTLDDTNNTADTVYANDIGDTTVPEDGVLIAIVSARSGTVSERNVTVVAEGYRTVF